MSDTAQQAWRRWWDEEGSAERPLPNEDAEQFARRITEIAWLNGAFKRLAEVERLRAKLAAANAQLVAKTDELVAMSKMLAAVTMIMEEMQRDEAAGTATKGVARE